MLAIILTGAAILREREHGTLEHLLVMPITSFEIALSKVWATGIVNLVLFALSMVFVVEGAIGVPFAGSRLLLLMGTVVYLFAAAAVGILLATIARSMAQYGLPCMITIIPMMMLSGGMSPLESQPDWLQRITWFLPSRQYMSFAQAIAFRGVCGLLHDDSEPGWSFGRVFALTLGGFCRRGVVARPMPRVLRSNGPHSRLPRSAFTRRRLAYTG